MLVTGNPVEKIPKKGLISLKNKQRGGLQEFLFNGGGGALLLLYARGEKRRSIGVECKR